MADNNPANIFQVAAKTDTGRVRDHNEDNYVVSKDLAVDNWFIDNENQVLSEDGCAILVADGMGGLNAGEVASDIAIKSLQAFFRDNKLSSNDPVAIEDFLFNGIDIAQKELLAHARENPETKGMGTTLIIGLIRDGKLNLAWVGDSRCYLLRNGNIIQVSKDHSYVQELVDKNKLTAEEAFFHPEGNIILRSLGDGATNAKPDFLQYDLIQKDRVLLCSDGLNSMLQDAEIEEILQKFSDIQQCANELIVRANLAGGHDNITVILFDCLAWEKTKVITPSEPEPMSPVLEPVLVEEQISTIDNEPVKKKTKWLIPIILIAILSLAIISYFKRNGNNTQIINHQDSEKTDSPKLKVLLEEKTTTGIQEKDTKTVEVDRKKLINKLNKNKEDSGIQLKKDQGELDITPISEDMPNAN